MATINQRQKKICEYLLKNGHSVCSRISQHVRVSEKTVRKEIHSINEEFHRPVIRSDQNGFYIVGDEYNIVIEAVNQAVEDTNRKLLRYLLLNIRPNDVDSIADHFYFSPTALANKVKQINQEIAPYHLSIRRNDNCLHIIGNEYDRQKLYLDLIYQDADNQFRTIEDFAEYFPGIDVHEAQKVIREEVSAAGCSIPVYYEKNVIINILTMLCFYRNNPVEIEASADDTKIRGIAAGIVRRLMNESERPDLINFVQSCLSGVLVTGEDNIYHRPYSPEFEEKLNEVVKNCFAKFGIFIDTAQFMSFFPAHIYNLIERCQSGNYCSYPNNQNLQTESMYIYDVAVSLCDELNKAFDILIPNTEITLIAIHIGFAIESYYNQSKKLNVLLFSNGYHLVENYITKIILEKYSDQVNLICSRTNTDFNKFDLILTTTKLWHNDNVEVCQISPFLTAKDKSMIDQAISDCLKKSRKKEFITLLKEYFAPQLFFIDRSISSREKAISFLSDQLVKDHAVHPSFQDAVLYRESLNPTSFMNTFAVPHSFQAEALKNRIAVLINPDGIAWGCQQVKIVFLIAISNNNNDSQKILLDGLGNMLTNESLVENLMQTKSFEDFMTIIITSVKTG